MLDSFASLFLLIVLSNSLVMSDSDSDSDADLDFEDLELVVLVMPLIGPYSGDWLQPFCFNDNCFPITAERVDGWERRSKEEDWAAANNLGVCSSLHVLTAASIMRPHTSLFLFVLLVPNFCWVSASLCSLCVCLRLAPRIKPIQSVAIIR